MKTKTSNEWMNVSDKVGSEQELTAESSPVSGPDRGPKRWGQNSDKVNEPQAHVRPSTGVQLSAWSKALRRAALSLTSKTEKFQPLSWERGKIHWEPRVRWITHNNCSSRPEQVIIHYFYGKGTPSWEMNRKTSPSDTWRILAAANIKPPCREADTPGVRNPLMKRS